MTLDEIKAALDDALALRFPRFDAEHTGKQRVEKLENHMLESAYVSGNLVAARHWLRLLEANLAEAWETMQGWETFTTVPRQRQTKVIINEAKKRASPEGYAAGVKAKQLRESIVDQVARLEREERVCSRAYTMETGG